MNCNGLSFTYWCVSIHLCLEDYTAKETGKSNSSLFCFSSRIYTRFKERERVTIRAEIYSFIMNYKLSRSLFLLFFYFIFGSGEEKLRLHTMESTTWKLERDSNIHRRGISALIKSRMWVSLLRRSRIFFFFFFSSQKRKKRKSLRPSFFIFPGFSIPVVTKITENKGVKGRRGNPLDDVT